MKISRILYQKSIILERSALIPKIKIWINTSELEYVAKTQYVACSQIPHFRWRAIQNYKYMFTVIALHIRQAPTMMNQNHYRYYTGDCLESQETRVQPYNVCTIKTHLTTNKPKTLPSDIACIVILREMHLYISITDGWYRKKTCSHVPHPWQYYQYGASLKWHHVPFVYCNATGA